MIMTYEYYVFQFMKIEKLLWTLNINNQHAIE